MRLFEFDSPPQYLYHVTFSKNVPGIKKKGLLQFQPSNWVKGDGGTRYNEDAGIFAFEHPEDAFKWAFKMQWEFNQPISIVRIATSEVWDKDPSQDFSLQSGKGRPLRSTRNIPAAQIIDAFSMEDFSNPVELGINQDEWFQRINKTLSEDGQSQKLPAAIAKAFAKIADEQRGAPEHAMLRVQRVFGGGVLNPVVEHVGDLLHRMTEHAEYGDYLPSIIKEKVDRGLRYLTHPYGFEKELSENLRNNETDITKLNQMLSQYASEHRKLPVYNAAHYAAREAAVSLGEQDWHSATEYLRYLKNMLDDGSYIQVVSSYQLDQDGTLIQYTP